MEQNMEKKIDALFSKWSKGVCPGGQVRIRKGGEVIYSKNFGYANLEHRIPIQDETVFHVASISKQITVMCILLLAEEGKLQIDDDVRKYLPDLIHFKEPVTLRNMMNNVSGIRDQWELLSLSGVRLRDTITQDDALSMIARQKTLNFEPLSQFLYSNSNFTLLAEIVERLSGKKINEFLNELVFKPLGMNKTQFKDAYWKVIENRAESYGDDGNGHLIHSVLNYGTYGATSLNTTADDFLKWMDNYKKPVICSKKTLDIMFTAPKLKDGTDSNYACGLFVGERKRHRYIEHGGSDAAYRSQMLRFIEDDLDIIVFSNTNSIQPHQSAFQIADIVLGLEEVKNVKGGTKENNKADKNKYTDQEFYRDHIDIKEIPGFYVADYNGYNITIEIGIEDGKLYEDTPFGHIPLEHQSGNCFKLDAFTLFFGEECKLMLNEEAYPFKKLKPYQDEDLDNYAGTYVSEELGTTFYMKIENDSLYLDHSRKGKSLLYQLNEHELLNQKDGTTIKMIKHKDDINGFLLSGGRVKSIELTKVKSQ